MPPQIHYLTETPNLSHYLHHDEINNLITWSTNPCDLLTHPQSLSCCLLLQQSTALVLRLIQKSKQGYVAHLVTHIIEREKCTKYIYPKVILFMILIIEKVISGLYVYGYNYQNSNKYVIDKLK